MVSPIRWRAQKGLNFQQGPLADVHRGRSPRSSPSPSPGRGSSASSARFRISPRGRCCGSGRSRFRRARRTTCYKSRRNDRSEIPRRLPPRHRQSAHAGRHRNPVHPARARLSVRQSRAARQHRNGHRRADRDRRRAGRRARRFPTTSWKTATSFSSADRPRGIANGSSAIDEDNFVAIDLSQPSTDGRKLAVAGVNLEEITLGRSAARLAASGRDSDRADPASDRDAQPRRAVHRDGRAAGVGSSNSSASRSWRSRPSAS